MTPAEDVFVIILLFSIFGIIHSVLASNKIKKSVASFLGGLIAFYRAIYIVLSLIIFYLIYTLVPNDHVTVFDLPYPFDFIILVPQLGSLVGLLWTLKYFDVREFIGINQILRWFKKNYDEEELDEELTLRIRGPYKYVRHPLYLFSILFLAFRPEMDLNYLTFLLCIIAYFYIGSFYEERKLVEKFGDMYVKYRKTVPRIFPSFKIKPYKQSEI